MRKCSVFYGKSQSLLCGFLFVCAIAQLEWLFVQKASGAISFLYGLSKLDVDQNNVPIF